MNVEPAGGGTRARLPMIVLLSVCAGALIAWAAGGWLSSRRPDALPRPVAALPAPEQHDGEVIVPEHSAWRDALSIVPVTADFVSSARTLPASVESDPAEVVNVLPPLGGRVIDVAVRLGAAVTAGQVLVRIESSDMAQARADAAKATAQLDLARHALTRANGLAQIGGGAARDTESARNDLAQAQAENDRAQVRLRTLGALKTDGRGLVITAPISGVVTTLATAPGSYINDTTQSLMTIDQTRHVLVTALAAEDDLAYVAAGDEVRIALPAYPDELRHGVVQSVDAVTQPDTRRTRVRIELDNPGGRLRAGMFASVSIDTPPRPRIMVSDSALLMNNDSTTVFVETRPYVFVRRTVQTGQDRDGRSEVLTGLSAGERVVVRGGVLLGD